MPVRTEWRERLAKDDQEKLRNLFLQTHTQKEWNDFIAHECWRKNITYDTLPVFLQKSGLTMRDLFAHLGIEVAFPNNQAAQIATYCKDLSNDEIQRIYKIVKMTAPALPFEDPKMGPLKRLTSLYRTTFSVNKENKDEARQGKARNNITVSASAISFNSIIQIANEMELSLHWILNLGDEISVYTDSPMIDSILDYFSFSSPQLKKVFLNLLQEICAAKR